MLNVICQAYYLDADETDSLSRRRGFTLIF